MSHICIVSFMYMWTMFWDYHGKEVIIVRLHKMATTPVVWLLQDNMQWYLQGLYSSGGMKALPLQGLVCPPPLQIGLIKGPPSQFLYWIFVPEIWGGARITSRGNKNQLPPSPLPPPPPHTHKKQWSLACGMPTTEIAGTIYSVALTKHTSPKQLSAVTHNCTFKHPYKYIGTYIQTVELQKHKLLRQR